MAMDLSMRKSPMMTLEEQMELEDMRTLLNLDYLANQGCHNGDDGFPVRPFITTLSSIGQPIEPSLSFVYDCDYYHETMTEEQLFETAERMLLEPVHEDPLDNEDEVKDNDEGHDEVHDKDHDTDNEDEEVEIVAEIIYDHGYRYEVDKNDRVIGVEMVNGYDADLDDQDDIDLNDLAPVLSIPSTKGPMKLGPWDEQLRQYAHKSVEEGMNYEKVLETIETVLDEKKKKKKKKKTTKKRGSIASAHADTSSKKHKKQ